MRDEQIAPVPRQCAAGVGGLQNAHPGHGGVPVPDTANGPDAAIVGLDTAIAGLDSAGIPLSVWTIRPADGIRAVRALQPAESS